MGVTSLRLIGWSNHGVLESPALRSISPLAFSSGDSPAICDDNEARPTVPAEKALASRAFLPPGDTAGTRVSQTCRVVEHCHEYIWWFPKIGVPPNHPLYIYIYSRIFYYKPTILGYPHFSKPPFGWIVTTINHLTVKSLGGYWHKSSPNGLSYGIISKDSKLWSCIMMYPFFFHRSS